jgi:hypothetical protein
MKVQWQATTEKTNGSGGIEKFRKTKSLRVDKTGLFV